METRARFDSGQSTRLSCAPLSDEFLEILQCSSQELAEFIKIQVERNPLLEIDEDFKCNKGDIVPDDEYCPADWWEYSDSTDDDIEAYDSNDFFQQTNNLCCYMDNTFHPNISLYEYLMFQLQVMNLPYTDRKIASFIIKHINDNGYLTISKVEIANRLKVDRNKVSECLKLVQSFDPPGVGARSVRECLLIQLKQKGFLTPAVKTIVINHLKDIASGNYDAISKKQRLDINKVKKICSVIKSLEPKPGRLYLRNGIISYAFPDIEVVKLGGRFLVHVSDICAPRLTVSKIYHSLLNKADLEYSVVKFIKEHLENAYMTINLIDRRRKTIKKVAESIMKHQSDFIFKGPGFLKHISISTISEDAKLHESVVNKAIREKLIQTPYGLYKLETFINK